MPNDPVPHQVDIPNVSVEIGSFDDYAPNDLYDTGQFGQGIFTDYYIVQRYEKDKQRWMMPVTSPDGFDGDSVAFVQLAGETLLRIVDWTAERAGNAPPVPEPESQDSNLVLLDDHTEPAMLQKHPDGTLVYRISGTYFYGFKNPSQAKREYGRPPWMSKDIECDVSDSQFEGGIIDCGSTQSESEGQ